MIAEVSAADGVPEGEEGPVVSHVVRVVEVMDVCSGSEGEVAEGAEPEVVATVAVDALQQSHHQPDPEGLHVGPEQEWAQEEAWGVYEGVL